MFSSISSYLFGSNSEDGSENLEETLVTEPNGGDWVLVDSKEQVTSVGQSILMDSDSNKPDEDKENDSSDDASSISSLSESSSTEHDDENEMRSYVTAKPAKKVKKPRKPRIIIDDHNGFSAGLMDGSWFVTPPPCFIRHKKSKKRLIASSPMEDMLIEHPSISVYQANTSTDSSINKPNITPFDYLIEAFDYFPSLTAISKNIAWPEWNGQTKIKIPAARLISKPTTSTQRKSPKKQNCSNRQQLNSQDDHHQANYSSNYFNKLPQVNQPHASRELRALNNDANQHDRNDYLQEINNLQYNLAPMQKAINQGSQKFLKKSFLNRQNLVKSRSDRRRFTQPPKCHPLKMC
ncbi:uncharacterized protein LOC128394319 [Panonychus citri]|uniref:uncharacterized protein LOC128394319 n=1 Tax=Panonychus citri TaxID=50023 RepID=UPI002307D200|nr:uncharacterized protein LOC128394319 [Panonychus citri]